MNLFQSMIAFLGRICLSFIFIASGVNTLFDWQGSEQYLHNHLCDWLTVSLGVEWAQRSCEMAMNWSSLLLGTATVCEILGGFCIFVGIKIRFGAVLLLLFMVPSTFLFHHFWTLQGAERELQTILFMKDLSIIGGLLILLAFGKGCKTARKQVQADAKD